MPLETATSAEEKAYFDQLKKQSNVKLDPTYSVKSYLQSSFKLILQGDKLLDNQLYEEAYISYLKACCIGIDILPKHPEFQKVGKNSKDYFNLKIQLKRSLDTIENFITPILLEKRALQNKTKLQPIKKPLQKNNSIDLTPPQELRRGGSSDILLNPPKPFGPSSYTQLSSSRNSSIESFQELSKELESHLKSIYEKYLIQNISLKFMNFQEFQKQTFSKILIILLNDTNENLHINSITLTTLFPFMIQLDKKQLVKQFQTKKFYHLSEFLQNSSNHPEDYEKLMKNSFEEIIIMNVNREEIPEFNIKQYQKFSKSFQDKVQLILWIYELIKGDVLIQLNHEIYLFKDSIQLIEKNYPTLLEKANDLDQFHSKYPEISLKSEIQSIQQVYEQFSADKVISYSFGRNISKTVHDYFATHQDIQSPPRRPPRNHQRPSSKSSKSSPSSSISNLSNDFKRDYSYDLVKNNPQKLKSYENGDQRLDSSNPSNGLHPIDHSNGLPRSDSSRNGLYPDLSDSSSLTVQTNLKRKATLFDHPYYGFTHTPDTPVPPHSPSMSKPLPPIPANEISRLPPKRDTPVAPPPAPSPATISSSPMNSLIGSPQRLNHLPPKPNKVNGIVPPIPPRIIQKPPSEPTIPPINVPSTINQLSRFGHIGLTGLKNLGNTCFMNSMLQCLSGTSPLVRYFLNGSYRRHLNRSNPLGTKGRLTESFSQLLRNMWSEQSPFISPLQFKEMIDEFIPQFKGTNQHDSQEFLVYLLDRLHEDLKQIRDDPNLQNLDLEKVEDQCSEEKMAQLYWMKYLLRNDSIIVNLFQGQIQSKLTCLTCGKTSNTYNAFMYLSLPIPNPANRSLHLYQCMDEFVKEEILDHDEAWTCPRCKQKRRSSKKLTISKLPDILLVQLKRFSFDGPFRDKLQTLVNFPLAQLNLSKYLIPSIDAKKHTYDLYAVSNHYGSLSGGHYTAFVRNFSRGNWNSFDDTRLDIIDESKIVSEAAYSLFYVRSNVD